MMKSDRYLKVILTVIAVELGWMAFDHAATPVTAQAKPTQVVITGVEMGTRGLLPVGVVGQVSVAGTVPVQTIGVVKIEADKPLKVENVGYTPGQRPGE